jgi:outer membrane immunogenic protein
MRVVTGLVLAVVWGTAPGIASAADLPVSAEPSWTGAYIGANVGYGWAPDSVGLSESSTDPAFDGFLGAAANAGVFPTSLSPGARGLLGGGQAGYNWQLPSGWVVGVEADLNVSGITGSSSVTTTPSGFDDTQTGVSKKIDWFGTVRGRAGYLVNAQWLLYATAGLAYGKTSLNFNTTDVTSGCLVNAFICADQTSSGVKLGWTAGAGIETMLTPNWSIKAEYLYVDLGKRSFDATSNTPIVFTASSAYHEQIVDFGLNYHFN